MRLVLFDIDGTLITTGRAGMRAYYRAFQSVFGITMDDDVIRPDGKTDPMIARELLAFSNRSDHWCDSSKEALFETYLACLEQEMCDAGDRGLIRVLPGVSGFLDLLSTQPDFAVGLVTGNLEKGARIKLEKAGIHKYFRFGGYGSDSEDRTCLTRIGIERGMEFVAPVPVEAAFIIGDPPYDIIHGHAAGASVIAVASANYSPAELEAHGPDLLIPDLTPAGEIISFMRAASAGP
jgi:phosphoglycolate phosphatase